jgi:hypothetical protein
MPRASLMDLEVELNIKGYFITRYLERETLIKRGKND